jgi:hypothetical protein
MKAQRLFVSMSMSGLCLLMGAAGTAHARTLQLDSAFSSTQSATLTKAFADAEAMAADSYNVLAAVPSGATVERANSPRFQHACDAGSYKTMTTSDWDAFTANFLKVYQAIRDNTFKVVSGGIECDSSTAAYYNTSGIHICSYFWQLKTQRPYGFSSQAGALLHEITHMSSVLGTSDNPNSVPYKGLVTSYTYHRFAENDPSLSIITAGARVWFSGGDMMRNPGKVDWDYGYWKGDCNNSEAITGISGTQAGTWAVAGLCRVEDTNGSYKQTISSEAKRGAYRSINGSTDWDYGYYKLECGYGEFVSGFSDVPNSAKPALHAIRCSTGSVSTNSGCETIPVGGRDYRSSVSEDWNWNYVKSECTLGKVAVGVSLDTTYGRPHKLLCCSR